MMSSLTSVAVVECNAAAVAVQRVVVVANAKAFVALDTLQIC